MDFSEAALDERIASGQAQLTEAEGKQFLAQAGVQIPQGAVAKTYEEVLEAARRIGYPVVLKGQLREVTHKSDLGLVKVNIKNDEELKAQYEDISGKCEKLGSDWHVLVEQMLDTSVEMIAAINEDPVFGKVLMFGLGGIYVEVMKDISFGICPITRDDARQMINELRCSKIFDGARGRAPIDREKIVDFLMSLGGRGGICEKYDSRVATVEINPIVFTAGGDAVALDAVVTLKQKGPERAPFAPVDMTPMFNPKSIAIVGVSAKPSMALTFLKQSLEAGYAGRVYPINPAHAGEELMGHKIYGSLREVPEEVDYVYIAVPATAVPGVIEDAAQKHAKFAHIISGGFAEVGAEGKALEQEVLRIAREHGVRLVGPNCMGMVSTAPGLIFTTGVSPERGGVSLISQSGGITTEILRAGSAQGIRFNQAVSAGNCADLATEEFLEYMGNDPDTKVIGMYCENIRDGGLMCRLLKEVSKKKPVVIIKGGRSSAGAKAAASHTGALSSSYKLWQTMARQTGAVLVRTLEEFLNALLAFQNLEPTEDNSVLLVSHSGGVVVTSTDLSEDYKLTLPKVDKEIQKELLGLGLPPGANVSNPMDISLGVMAAKTKEGDSISVIGDIFRYVGARAAYGYYVFYLMADNVIESGGGKQLIHNIYDFAAQWGGRGGEHAGHFVLAANCHTHPEYIEKLNEGVRKNGVTVFPNINEMLQSIGWLAAYGKWKAEHEEELP